MSDDAKVPLPPAAVDEHNLQGGRLLYTHEQMRAYGDAVERAARAAEREACARLVETHDTYGDPVGSWFKLLADAIRARAEGGA